MHTQYLNTYKSQCYRDYEVEKAYLHKIEFQDWLHMNTMGHSTGVVTKCHTSQPHTELDTEMDKVDKLGDQQCLGNTYDDD